MSAFYLESKLAFLESLRVRIGIPPHKDVKGMGNHAAGYSTKLPAQSQNKKTPNWNAKNTAKSEREKSANKISTPKKRQIVINANGNASGMNNCFADCGCPKVFQLSSSVFHQVRLRVTATAVTVRLNIRT